MKIGIVEIGEKHLRSILQLPDSCEIVDIDFDIERNGVILFKVVGIGAEVSEGGVIPRIVGICHGRECDSAIISFKPR